jgi:hypothetical protein
MRERKKNAKWVVTRTKVREEELAKTINQAVVISPALERVADIRVESMEADPSVMITAKIDGEIMTLGIGKMMTIVDTTKNLSEAATTAAEEGVILTATQVLTLVSNPGPRVTAEERRVSTKADTRSKAMVVETSATLMTIHRPTRGLAVDGMINMAPPDMMKDRSKVTRNTPTHAMTIALIRDMMIAHSTKSIKEDSQAPRATTIDLRAKSTSLEGRISTRDISKERAKWEIAPSIQLAHATWTKALESLMSTGTEILRTSSTLSFLRSCTSTASYSSLTIVLSSAVQPT